MVHALCRTNVAQTLSDWIKIVLGSKNGVKTREIRGELARGILADAISLLL